VSALTLRVNGQARTVNLDDPGEPLLYVLRNDLGLHPDPVQAAFIAEAAALRPDRATIWTPSQATHRFREPFAGILKLPRDPVRLIYIDGAGSYGVNGSDDAACDAVLLSKAVRRPVRVQWTRQDELGWDPKGPAQLLDLRAAVRDGDVAAWETQAWLPAATAGLPNVPLLAPDEARIPQHPGISTGLISQHPEPPYGFRNVRIVIHRLAETPLRTSQLRSPGKPGNTFAVESLVDELAAPASTRGSSGCGGSRIRGRRRRSGGSPRGCAGRRGRPRAGPTRRRRCSSDAAWPTCTTKTPKTTSPPAWKWKSNGAQAGSR